MTSLWYLACKTTFREVSVQFGYHTGTFNNVFYKVLNVINQTTDLNMTSPKDLEATRKEFETDHDFPGTIDGTLIKLKVPETVQKN